MCVYIYMCLLSTKISQTGPVCTGILRFDKPEDGMPVIADWIQTAESILFGGLDLGREPLDCSMETHGGMVYMLKEQKSQVPVSKKVWVKTCQDQTSFNLHLFPCSCIMDLRNGFHGCCEGLDKGICDSSVPDRSFRKGLDGSDMSRAAEADVQGLGPGLDVAMPCDLTNVDIILVLLGYYFLWCLFC